MQKFEFRSIDNISIGSIHTDGVDFDSLCCITQIVWESATIPSPTMNYGPIYPITLVTWAKDNQLSCLFSQETDVGFIQLIVEREGDTPTDVGYWRDCERHVVVDHFDETSTDYVDYAIENLPEDISIESLVIDTTDDPTLKGSDWTYDLIIDNGASIEESSGELIGRVGAVPYTLFTASAWDDTAVTSFETAVDAVIDGENSLGSTIPDGVNIHCTISTYPPVSADYIWSGTTWIEQ